MNIYKIVLFALIFSSSSFASAQSDYLYNGQTLNKGQKIVTPSGRFQLVMQTDGNLVMYRPDGSVRYRMGNGAYAVMQMDGNFVHYKADGNAVFNTGTNTGTANLLHIQEDGNLVVYTPSYTPLWNLGDDPSPNDPKKVGDIVGRDLAFAGVGYLGHLGVYDGSQVVQVGPPVSGNNAVHYESLQSFKNTRTSSGSYVAYWGAASTPIADGGIAKCFKAYCKTNPYEYEVTIARTAVSKRAYQIYLIGADYTAVATRVRALPASENRAASRGMYRCDTFVLDLLEESQSYLTATTILSQAQQTWISRYDTLIRGIWTPGTIFNTVKGFN